LIIDPDSGHGSHFQYPDISLLHARVYLFIVLFTLC
jgi:hypothetical protein